MKLGNYYADISRGKQIRLFKPRSELVGKLGRSDISDIFHLVHGDLAPVKGADPRDPDHYRYSEKRLAILPYDRAERSALSKLAPGTALRVADEESRDFVPHYGVSRRKLLFHIPWIFRFWTRKPSFLTFRCTHSDAGSSRRQVAQIR